MDLLEDFFARKKLYETSIEVSKIEDITLAESPTPVLVIVIRKGGTKPRKPPRKPGFSRRPGFYRAKLSPKTSPRPWLEWLRIPRAIEQFWWLALLSLPALSAQCDPLHTLDFVDISQLPNSENLLSLIRQ